MESNRHFKVWTLNLSTLPPFTSSSKSSNPLSFVYYQCKMKPFLMEWIWTAWDIFVATEIKNSKTISRPHRTVRQQWYWLVRITFDPVSQSWFPLGLEMEFFKSLSGEQKKPLTLWESLSPFLKHGYIFS